MNEIKVLNQDEFYFCILIDNQNEFFGLNGLMQLSSKLPNTVNTLAVKESNELCKIYCFTNSENVLKQIENQYNVKTEIF